MRKVGLQQVASEAGVSLTTASHALSGKGRVPESTRQRVRDAAMRLGYHPNSAARGLATGRAMTLAVQMSGMEPASGALIPESSYFVSLLNGASTAATALGYSLVLAPPDVDMSVLSRMHIDGAIVVDPVGRESSLARQTVPIVATGRPPNAASSVAWVDNDHQVVAQVALDHLHDRGYRRPVLLTTSGHQSYLHDAEDAYRRWCSRHAVEPVVREVPGALSEEAAALATTESLRAHPECDSVYATLDRLAVGALLGVEAAERTVGRDVGVVSLFDSPLLTAVRPRITAVHLRADEIGRQAARLLVDLVGGRRPESPHRLVDTELRIRESTAGREA